MLELYSYFFYLISILTFFLLGYYILEKLIIEDFEVKSWLPIMIFCINFSFSVMLMELLLFEVLGIGSKEYGL